MATPRCRMLIATTEGPAAIQKITREDPEVRSVVCLDGTTEMLPICKDYVQFVNRGTGIVADETGHDAYRLDLDARVHGGTSWQLPVLLAHRLAAEGRLAAPDDDSADAILATGVVDRDQRVRPVEAIPEKLASARERLKAIIGAGRRVIVVLPATGEAGNDDDADKALADFGDQVTVQRWERVRPLADVFAGKSPAPQPEEPLAAPDPAPKKQARVRRRRWPALLAVAVVLLAGVVWWVGPRHWETLRRDGEYQALDGALRNTVLTPVAALYRSWREFRAEAAFDIRLEVVEHRSADGGSCAGRRFRDAGLVATPLAVARPGYFRSNAGRSLCRLGYVLTNQGDQLFYAYLGAAPVGAGAAGTMRAAALPPNASTSVEIDPRDLATGQTGVVMFALAAPAPSPDLRRALRGAIPDAEATKAAGEPALALSELPELGVTFATASHAIVRDGGER